MSPLIMYDLLEGVLTVKANSLSISIPSLKGEQFFCNKDCPYCISKMTGMNPVSIDRFVNNFDKAKHLAEMAMVSSVIITGKTEPLTNMSMVKVACEAFSEFPIEIQTNGILLSEKVIHALDDLRVDTVAISVDSIEQIHSLKKAISVIRELGMTVRFTINLTNDTINSYEGDLTERVKKFIGLSKSYGVEQVSFRNITVPLSPVGTTESLATKKWIEDNVSAELSNEFVNAYTNLLKEKGVKVAELAFGAVIYMYEGISCTYFDYCIQDENNGENIRSLIYYEDGHMSTTWYGSNYGRIF